MPKTITKKSNEKETATEEVLDDAEKNWHEYWTYANVDAAKEMSKKSESKLKSELQLKLGEEFKDLDNQVNMAIAAFMSRKFRQEEEQGCLHLYHIFHYVSFGYSYIPEISIKENWFLIQAYLVKKADSQLKKANKKGIDLLGLQDFNNYWEETINE